MAYKKIDKNKKKFNREFKIGYDSLENMLQTIITIIETTNCNNKVSTKNKVQKEFRTARGALANLQILYLEKCGELEAEKKKPVDIESMDFMELTNEQLEIVRLKGNQELMRRNTVVKI